MLNLYGSLSPFPYIHLRIVDSNKKGNLLEVALAKADTNNFLCENFFLFGNFLHLFCKKKDFTFKEKMKCGLSSWKKIVLVH